MYDHPPDEDVPFVSYVRVGDSFPAVAARKLTSAVNDVDALLDSLSPFP